MKETIRDDLYEDKQPDCEIVSCGERKSRRNLIKSYNDVLKENQELKLELQTITDTTKDENIKELIRERSEKRTYRNELEIARQKINDLELKLKHSDTELKNKIVDFTQLKEKWELDQDIQKKIKIMDEITGKVRKLEIRHAGLLKKIEGSEEKLKLIVFDYNTLVDKYNNEYPKLKKLESKIKKCKFELYLLENNDLIKNHKKIKIKRNKLSDLFYNFYEKIRLKLFKSKNSLNLPKKLNKYQGD